MLKETFTSRCREVLSTVKVMSDPDNKLFTVTAQ